MLKKGGIILFILLQSYFLIAQYCIPIVKDSALGITNIQLNTLNNPSAAPEGYKDYTASDTPTITQGLVNTINITTIGPGNSRIYIWIDWNKNDTFEQGNGELSVFTPFTIPFGGTTPLVINLINAKEEGITRMRVIAGGTGVLLFNTCDTAFPNGDIEDYIVNVKLPPMRLDSIIVTKETPCCMLPDKPRKEIIGIQIKTFNKGTPITVKELNFNSAFSTNMTDVINAEVWYSGTNVGNLSNKKLFGTISFPPNGAFSISGSQTLTPVPDPLLQTTHYFWLTYDISPSATVENALDGSCTSITIDSSGIPIVKIPSNSEISGIYIIESPAARPLDKHANVWYFGRYLGIDFNCEPPKSMLDSRMDTKESVASISDKNGKLIFYTNAENIWNAQHDTMENGHNLKGHYLSTSGALIIPMPASDSLYYVFTSGQGYTDSLFCHIVDISANNGLGKVVAKNIFFTEIAEQKAVTQHCNGKDFWLTAIHANSPPSFDILSYKLDYNPEIDNTPDAVLPTPVINNVALNDISILNRSLPGNTVFSPDGSRFACLGQTQAYILGFDNSTGLLCPSDRLDLDLSGEGLSIDGIQFSPNNSKLYLSIDNKLFQYNMNAGSNPAIIASRLLIDTFMSLNPANTIIALQNAPDGKMYIMPNRSSGLSINIIHQPNESGSACNLERDALKLVGKDHYGFGMNFPKFIDSYFWDSTNYIPLQADFEYTSACASDTVSFVNTSKYPKNTNPCLDWPKYHWSFGLSNATDTSILKNPKFIYGVAGFYFVTLIIEDKCQMDTITKMIHIIGDTSYVLPDTSICKGDSIFIGIDSAIGSNYLWSPSYALNDTVISIVQAKPDTSISYQLIISNVSCADTLYQNIVLNPLPPNITLSSSDSVLCPGNTVQFFPEAEGSPIYSWSPPDYLSDPNISSPIASPKESIKYKVEAYNICGADSANIHIEVLPNCSVFIPNVFSPNSDGQNDLFFVTANSLTDINFNVYDIWGKLIFKTENIKIGWNGVSNQNNISNSAIYIYHLQGKLNGKDIDVTGNITIMR